MPENVKTEAGATCYVGRVVANVFTSASKRTMGVQLVPFRTQLPKAFMTGVLNVGKRNQDSHGHRIQPWSL